MTSKRELAILAKSKAVDPEVVELRNSLTNLVTQLGAANEMSNLTSMQPLLANTIYYPLTLQHQLLTYMYSTHGVLQTAIDLPVQDALRGGLDLHSDQFDDDDLKDLHKFMNRSGILSAIKKSRSWTRLFGGGALVINTGQEMDKPLSLKGIKKLQLYAANRWEFSMPGVNPNAPWELLNFGIPVDSEYFLFYGHRLHRSRVITMCGLEAPYLRKWQLQGWGMSEVERMIEDFNKYLKTSNVLYELLEQAKLDVYQMEGFNAQLLTSKGTSRTMNKIQKMNELKNFNRAIVLDAKDKYEQKQLTFAGIAEIMKENRTAIAAALRIPMTKLYGISASGFNSGEDDIENYNAMVESEVREPMREVIYKVLDLVIAMMFGVEESDIDFDYKPLRVLGAEQEETIKSSKQRRHMDLFDRGVYNAKELVEVMKQDNLITTKIEAESGVLDEREQPGDEKEDGDGARERK
jgi:uncharacterized protein